jgi:hypothetical protein
VLRELVAQQTFVFVVFVRTFAVAAVAFENLGSARGTQKTNRRRSEYDDGERDIEKENADECRRREQSERIVFERTLADAHDRFNDNRQHGRFQSEEQGDHDRHLAVNRIDIAERHDRNDAGHHEEAAGNDPANRPMHEPADIDSELLCLRARQQHAIVERVKKSALRNPVFFIDDDAMHHGDLRRRSAEA